tara:strand:+ start:2664 stop:3239 length:576 start_codon:yes stop_codon:yes gene_type:complete
MSINIGSPKATGAQSQYINDYKQMVGGGDYQGYLENKTPPRSPYDNALSALENSGVGDMDYEREELMRQYQGGPQKASMDNFYAKNDDWYNADGSRTDYRMSDLDLQSKEWLNNGRQGANPVSTALRDFKGEAPLPVAAPRPPIVQPQQPAPAPVPQQPVQQAPQQQQATALRDFSAKAPTQSSWQAGGWG